MGDLTRRLARLERLGRPRPPTLGHDAFGVTSEKLARRFEELFLGLSEEEQRQLAEEFREEIERLRQTVRGDERG